MPEVQIMSHKGDTTLMYSLEEPAKYFEAKKKVKATLECGSVMYGVVNGIQMKLADAYTAKASLVTPTLEHQDELDKALLNEETTERVMRTPLVGG